MSKNTNSEQFDNCLQEVYDVYKLKLIKISEKHEEVNKIAEFIVNRMMINNEDIRKYVTEILTPRRQITQSNDTDCNDMSEDEKNSQNYELQIKLKLPFEFQAIADVQRPGYVRLQTQPHEIIDKSFVNRISLKNWFNRILEKTVGGDCPTFTWGPNKYTFLYAKEIDIEMEEEIAKIKVVDLQALKNKIFIRFEPILEFTTVSNKQTNSLTTTTNTTTAANKIPSMAPATATPTTNAAIVYNWLAIPMSHKKKELNNEHIFAVYGNGNELLQQQNNKHKFIGAIQAIELLCALWDSYNLPNLAGFILMNFLQMEIDKQDISFLQQTTSEILLHLLQSLLDAFNQEHIPFYFDQLGIVNYLEVLDAVDVAKYKKMLNEFLNKFIVLKNSETIFYTDVCELFDL